MKSSEQQILVVDDAPENIDILANILNEGYDVKAAVNGLEALQISHSQPKPDMVLLDVMMPDMDGYEVCKKLKNDPATSDIPVIFVTAKEEVADQGLGFELGAVDYITKPISRPIVLARVRTQLALHDQNRELSLRVKDSTHELVQTRLKIIQRLGRAAEYKDNETGLHVIRMSHYTRLMARCYGGHESWVDMIFNAAPMHDVGKIGIPDSILLKPGKLDANEWNIMKKHAEFGAEIIGNEHESLLQLSRTIALTHHEKWDGTGYPNNLSGKNIPLEGRIIAIADVFDALTSVRPYKKSWSVEDAVRYIDDSSGSHFDPGLIPIFHDVLPEILSIKEKYAEN